MYHHLFPLRLLTALRAVLFVVAMFACAGVSSSSIAARVDDDSKDSKVSAPRASDAATLLGTGPGACRELEQPSSAVRPAPVQRSQRSENREEGTSGPAAHATESTVDAGTGPGEPTQMGPCEEGVWWHKTWCKLNGSHVWCWDLGIVQICQQHCHYDACGIVIRF